MNFFAEIFYPTKNGYFVFREFTGYKMTLIKLQLFLFLLQSISVNASNSPFQFIINGDSSKVDSLLKVSSANKDLIQQVRAHNLLGAYYESVSNYSLATHHLSAALYKNQADVNEKVFSFNYLGYVYWHKSNYDSALFYHQNALDLAKKNQLNNSNLAFTYLMLGCDYYDLGDYIKTSEYFFESLQLYEKLNDVVGQIQAHNRLSKLYYKLKDYSKAKNHVTEAQRLNKDIQYHRETATSFNSIGNIQIETGSLNSALYYFSKTLSSFTKCGDVIGQSVACINLGDTYQSLFEASSSNTALLDSSFKYYQKSYLLNQKVDNKFGMIYGVWGMSDIEMKQGKVTNALVNYRRALQLSKDINAKSEEYNLYWKLYKVFEILKNQDSSYFYLKNYIYSRNELENEEQTKALLRQESKYEIEKRISEQKAEIEREKLIEAEKSRWKNYVIFGIIILVLILSYAVISSIKRLRIIRSKNETINTINAELTIQKKEITDSINYARTIQDAILPSENFFKDCGVNSFVFYKPKDIVAGDFYWLEKKGDMVFIAAADCTGHGVPGAMGSVLCSNALNRSLLEFGITDPGKILDKTRELIVDTFSKSEKDVKDGMDISLVAINTISFDIMWAGANNSLLYVHQGDAFEIKADKQAIGKTDNPVPFNTHYFKLQKGDILYLFTDGFADQFGGEKGKKFKYKPLKEMLVSNSKHPLTEQKNLLEDRFEKWKGNLEQVDDVCVIGISI